MEFNFINFRKEGKNPLGESPRLIKKPLFRVTFFKLGGSEGLHLKLIKYQCKKTHSVITKDRWFDYFRCKIYFQ